MVAWGSIVICGHRRLARATVAAGWAVFLWLAPALGNGPVPSVGDCVGLAAWLLVLTVAAEGVRGRRERIAALRRSREQEGLRMAEEERLRIARELHDVLAHNISLINVQSGVALHLLDEHPEQARSALSIINEASGEALREMRSVLGVLRGVDEHAPRRPTAGLERLDELVAHSAASGVEVTVHRHGSERPLPTAVDLAAFRIVQESLTNVARHAPGAAAEVTLQYGEQALELTVQNGTPPTRDPAVAVGARTDGAAAGTAGTAGTGNGILGMRERATALRGALEAGSGPEGGFRVHARLPYAGASA